MTQTLQLRGFRGLDIKPDVCPSARDMPLDQLVRVVTRSMVAAAAYDQAVIKYCRDYFEDVGNENLKFRHDVCHKLRGTTACTILWGVFLDSESFRSAYRNNSGREPPVMRDRNSEPSPSVFADFVRETKSPTLHEVQYKDVDNSLQQQTRLILRKAKEVELVEYTYVTQVKSLVVGTEKLFRFFTENLPEKMDIQ